MRKIWLLAALFTMLVLAACQGAGDTTGAAMECTLASTFPDPRDPTDVGIAELSAADRARGASNPVITLLEYSDFQCPYCSLAGRSLQEFEAAHPDEVQVIFRHFPLPMHDKANLAAQAAEAAGAQGKFWEMHDLLFAEGTWDTWIAMTPDAFETWLIEQAGSVGLDADQFGKDLNAEATVSYVEQAYGDAIQANLNSTPSLFIFINGELVLVPEDQIPYDAETLELVLALAKQEANHYETCPPMTVQKNKTYSAEFKTSKGDFTIELYADKAPLAVNNFVFLAKQGYYDGVPFHRVLEGYIAQAGDPTGSGAGGPGYTFADEIVDSLKFDRAGLVAMANAGTNTNGSQFFITYAAAPNLDGGYTIFGEVTSGMEVVDSLTPRDPSASGELPIPDTIISITITEGE